MNSKLVYICSPFSSIGNIEENAEKARIYCRAAMLLYPDIIPIAPHLYFPQFLYEHLPAERSLGMNTGIELLNECAELWVFSEGTISSGMQAEINHAYANGIPIYNGLKKIEGALPQ